MTMIELKRRYARLSAEIESLGGAGAPSAARLARLIAELDQIDRELALYRRRASAAPTLRDAVVWPRGARPLAA